MTLRWTSCLIAVAAAAMLPAAAAQAQSAPTKILVGLPPGGAVDISARLVADKLQQSLGTSVVVENRPGASTRLAIQAVKSAAPDGQTLLVTPNAVMTIYPHVFRKLGYDPFGDLAPVSQMLSWTYGFAVPTASPAKTFADFIALAKSDPKQAFYGSPSSGSAQHLLGLQIGELTGVKLEHVWFKGGADAMNALLSNSVPGAILTLGELTALHQGGKARILATFGAARSPQLPDVPTMTELGFPTLQASGTVGMFAPGGTPAATIERISAAVRAALDMPDVKARLVQMNVEPKGSTPAAFDALNRAEYARWEKPAKASGYVGD